ncbi:MAG: hypothetical protein ACYTG1_09690 [Planctomycetota bacterium]|jgi:hypothetical protein
MSHPVRAARAAAVAAACLLAGLAAAPAGVRPAGDPPVELEPRPLEADSIGVSLRLPRGTTIVTERVEGRTSIVATGGDPMPPWTIRIGTAGPVSPGATAADQMAGHLAGLEAAGRTHRVISNEAVRYADLDGQLCFVGQSVDDRDYALGWLALPRDDGSFLMIATVAEADRLATLRPLFDAVFRTIRVQSTTEVSLERRARLEQGRDLLAALTIDRLQEVLGHRQWTRIYRESTGGGPETEVGYAFLEVTSAPRDAISGRASELAGEEEGLLVRVRGRVVMEAETQTYFDSIAEYWMAFDGSAETWSVRVTNRRGGKSVYTEAETGIRNAPSVGEPRPMLTLIQSNDATRAREPYRWEVPEVYMSQALGWLIGRLLPRDLSEPREYAYYTYNFATAGPAVSLRVDRWSPATDGSGDWTLATRLGAATPVYVSTYGRDGRLRRRVRADGSITVPVEPAELEAIWRRKGLSTGMDDARRGR